MSNFTASRLMAVTGIKRWIGATVSRIGAIVRLRITNYFEEKEFILDRCVMKTVRR